MNVNRVRRRIATLTIGDVVMLAAFAMLLTVPGFQLLQSESRATLSAPFVRQTLDPPPAEMAGVRAGLIRCGDVTFAAAFDAGCEDDRERNRPAIRVGERCPFRRQRAAVSPLNAAVFPRPFLVVLNQYSNFATVIDVASDAIIGEFHTGFYADDLVFNRAGTRLYLTDRLANLVRVFRIDAGPFFTEIARVPTRAIDLDRREPTRYRTAFSCS